MYFTLVVRQLVTSSCNRTCKETDSCTASWSKMQVQLQLMQIALHYWLQSGWIQSIHLTVDSGKLNISDTCSRIAVILCGLICLASLYACDGFLRATSRRFQVIANFVGFSSTIGVEKCVIQFFSKLVSRKRDGPAQSIHLTVDIGNVYYLITASITVWKMRIARRPSLTAHYCSL